MKWGKFKQETSCYPHISYLLINLKILITQFSVFLLNITQLNLNKQTKKTNGVLTSYGVVYFKWANL